MKKRLLLLLSVLMTIPVLARDFTYTYEGQTLTYTVLSEEDKTCEVKGGGAIVGEVTIPSLILIEDKAYTVTTLGEYAFSHCKKLTSVVVPQTVVFIDETVFLDCSGLTQINVNPENRVYTSVEGVVFNKDCTRLIICPPGLDKTDYQIPSTVELIQKYAFSYCLLKGIIIPESVKKIDRFAFDHMPYLNHIIFSKGIKSIGDMAFSYCNELLTVDLPESVEELGAGVFYDCKELKSVTLSPAILSFGEELFYGCDKIEEIFYPTLTPTEAEADIFVGSIYYKATLFVPENAVEIYKTIDPWRRFNSIKPYVFNSVDNVIHADKPYEVFDLNGVAVGSDLNNLPSGIYILRQGELSKKIKI